MINRVSTRSDSPVSKPFLNEIIEAFETVWNRDDNADVEDFFPNADHPGFEHVALELLCVDLERRWHGGDAKTVEAYRQQFPEILSNPQAIEQLAFEEYRLRKHLGESVTPVEYARRFQIATDEWPDWSPVESLEGPIDERGDLLSVAGEMERLTSAIQNLPDVGGHFLGFEIVEQLGGSKFGRVYLARQPDLANRLVVIKIAAGHWPESERLARLQHTNVMPIYSVHQQDGMQVVCMPYLGRHTLCDVLQKLGDRSRISSSTIVELFAGLASHDTVPSTVPSTEAATQWPNPLRYLRSLTAEQLFVWIVSRIASGLAHAHERGILHRDLKPANILLTDDGQPMILDFNLSADVVAGGRASLLVGGTLPYMAPEHLKAVATGGPVDTRSDIYSLGVILYQMLTGRLPFEVQTGPIDVALAVMVDERTSATPSAREVRPDVSPAVDSIVRKCLAPDAKQRYQSARHLQEDLERHLRDYPLRHAPNRSVAERTGKWLRRNPQVRFIGAIAILVVVVVVAVATLLSLRGLQAKQESINVYEEFEKRSRAARVALSLPTTDQPALPKGIMAAKEALSLYHPDTTNWQDDRAYQLLDASRKERLEKSVEELLYLLADASYRRGKEFLQDAASQKRFLSEAMRYNEASQNIRGDADVPSALILQQAEIMSALGQEEEAARLRSHAKELPIENRTDRYYAAVQRIARREYAKAIPLLVRLQSEMPQDFLVWFLAGTSYYGVRELSDAEVCFSACIMLRPKSHYAYFDRGICRLEQRRFHEAERDFSEALELYPDRSVTWVNRALARLGLERFSEASEDLSKAIRAGRDDSLTYLLRSQAWQGMGDLKKAREDRETGLRREPANVDGWIRRGMTRLPNDPDGALADLDVALRLSPKSQKALQNKAHIYSEILSQPEEAIGALNRLLELNPRHVTALAGRGVQYARLGRRDPALQDGREALLLDRSALTTFQVACILSQTSQIVEDDAIEAVKLLREAFRQDSQWAMRAPQDDDLKPILHRPDFRELHAAALELDQARSTFGDVN